MSSAINTKGKKCAYNNFKRIRYFHGMLMSDRDFREEQLYHQEKRKLLNRHLHGWGVVCGLGVEIDDNGKYLVVQPGMALDCFGNEIVISEACKVDIDKLIIPDSSGNQNNDPCYEPPVTEKETTYYLGISYGESPADPVPVYAPPGGCEEKTCEHSRFHEGFCLELLTSCNPPKIYHDGGLFKKFADCENNGTYEGLEYTECDQYGEPQKCKCNKLGYFCRQPLPCPDCTRDQAAVIIGEVTVDRTGPNPIFTAVAINACRTYVFSSRMLRYLSAALFTELPKDILQVIIGEDEDPLMNPDCMVANPIHAICWLMKHLEIDGGKIRSKIQWFEEDGVAAAGPTEQVQEKVDKLEAEIKVLKATIAELKKLVESAVASAAPAAPAAPAKPAKPAPKRPSKKTGK